MRYAFKIFITSLFTFFSSFSIGQNSVQSFSGGWVLNVTRSTLLPDSEPLKKIVWEIKESGKSLKWTVTVTPQKGKIRYVKFDNKGDEKYHPVVGSRRPSVATATIVSPGIFEYASRLREQSEPFLKSKCTLSDNGAELICEMKSVLLDGGTGYQKLVFVRMSSIN